MSVSAVHKLLTNPFYTGTIIWGGMAYPGKHEPLVSPSQFQEVQRLLGRKTTIHPKERFFPYRGLARCGSCGRLLTAEAKTNRYGRRYTYYHCSRQGGSSGVCRERSLEQKDFEAQVDAYLKTLTIGEQFSSWLVSTLQRRRDSVTSRNADRNAAIEATLVNLRSALSELTDMRARRLIEDAEFIQKRSSVQKEIFRLESSRRNEPDFSIEPLSKLISFGSSLSKTFERADATARQLILHLVVSNLRVSDGKLIFEAAIPFALTRNGGGYPRLRADVDAVRTSNTLQFAPEESVDSAHCPYDGDQIADQLIAYSVEHPEDLLRRAKLVELLETGYDSPASPRGPSGWFSVRSMRSAIEQSRRAASRTSSSENGRLNSPSSSALMVRKSSGSSDERRSSQRIRPS